MEVQKLRCASCGAPVQGSGDSGGFECAYCGAAFAVRRDEAPARAHELQQELEETRDRLRKLELQHELTDMQAQLYRVQAEIRDLEALRRPSRRERDRYHGLRDEQERLLARIRHLEQILYPAPVAEPAQREAFSLQPGCAAVLPILVGLVACSCLGLVLTSFGIPPELALLAAVMVVVVVVNKYRRRRRESGS
jgi:uncharacterized Zn finger protein (UPF0148 family)